MNAWYFQECLVPCQVKRYKSLSRQGPTEYHGVTLASSSAHLREEPGEGQMTRLQGRTQELMLQKACELS